MSGSPSKSKLTMQKQQSSVPGPSSSITSGLVKPPSVVAALSDGHLRNADGFIHATKHATQAQKDAWLAKHFSAVRVPCLAGQPLDLYVLYHEVIARGGVEKVVQQRRWQEIRKLLELPSACTGAAFRLRTEYERLLYPLECQELHGREPAPHDVSSSMKKKKKKKVETKRVYETPVARPTPIIVRGETTAGQPKAQPIPSSMINYGKRKLLSGKASDDKRAKLGGIKGAQGKKGKKGAKSPIPAPMTNNRPGATLGGKGQLTRCSGKDVSGLDCDCRIPQATLVGAGLNLFEGICRAPNCRHLVNLHPVME